MTLPEMIADLTPAVKDLVGIYGLGSHTIEPDKTLLIVEAIANNNLAVAFTVKRDQATASFGFIFDKSILP